jgi:hypothetical protein
MLRNAGGHTMPRCRSISGLAVFVTMAAGSVVAQAPPAVPYPDGYRHWAVVKTTLVGATAPNFATRGGFHHFYANAAAMTGYRTGTFPDGAVIVDEGVHGEEVNGVTQERARRSVDVMHKDSAKYSASGGWGFEHFDGDARTGASADVRAACAKCHAQRKANDYVFSTFRP